MLKPRESTIVRGKIPVDETVVKLLHRTSKITKAKSWNRGKNCSANKANPKRWKAS